MENHAFMFDHSTSPPADGYTGEGGAAEWSARIQLANCYRIIAKLGAVDWVLLQLRENGERAAQVRRAGACFADVHKHAIHINTLRRVQFTI